MGCGQRQNGKKWHKADITLVLVVAISVLESPSPSLLMLPGSAHKYICRFVHSATAAGADLQVAQFEYHRAMVRDCSWHPYEPEMTSVSWDGSVVSWGPGLPQKQLGNQGRWGDVGRYY